VSTRAVDVVVTGRVQGVFYRASCAAHAEKWGVTGWMGNEADGSVAGHFEGSQEAVDALLEWCLVGPPRAVVSEVQVVDVEPQRLGRFEVR
jgi:acylphosphatase